MTTKSQRRICFVSPYAYPLLVPGASGAGGAERQFFLFARELEQRGWGVSFITGRPSQDMRAATPRFPVFPVDFTYLGGRKSQMPAAWLGLWNAMRAADAAHYVLKVPAHLLSVMALFCRTHRRQLASWGQTTCRSARHRSHIPSGARYLEEFGLRSADILIAQTEEQAAGLRDQTGRCVHVIPNIAEHVDATAVPAAGGVRCDVLWAGNSTANKRPGVVIELARALPDVSFAMAMNRTSAVDFERWKDAAASLPNLRFLGQLAPGEMESWFGRTRLFLNTSDREGFPNTFLQAWMKCVPVVSLGIDPDGLLGRHKLGRVAQAGEVTLAGEDPAKLARCLVTVVQDLLGSENLCKEIGVRAAAHIQGRHAPAVTVPALERVLLGSHRTEARHDQRDQA